MKDLVSNRWTSVPALVASTSVICALAVPDGFPALRMAWEALALSAASVLALVSAQTIEPLLAVAAPAPSPSRA